MATRNKVDRELRIERIFELIGEGYLTFEIVQIMTKEFGICRKTADRYFEIVFKFLKENNKVDREKVLISYQKLARKHEKDRPDLALKYRQQIDKITGLSEKSTIDVNHNHFKVELPKNKKDE
jgi:hypothetical protein